MTFEPFGADPLGAADADPGTIGTPALAATKAAPSNSGCTSGPLFRSPSGNSTSGSPALSTAMQRTNASLSTVPLVTGKPPNAERAQQEGLLPRVLAHAAQPATSTDTIGVSMLERCTGAIRTVRSAARSPAPPRSCGTTGGRSRRTPPSPRGRRATPASCRPWWCRRPSSRGRQTGSPSRATMRSTISSTLRSVVSTVTSTGWRAGGCRRGWSPGRPGRR